MPTTSANAPTAVMIGAGNIGRGFIGQILHDSGYHVVFVDVDAEIVDRLNHDGRYKLTLTDGLTSETRVIDRVSALDGGHAQPVADALAECDLAATAVGANALRSVAPSLARGIKERHRRHPGNPLNILICENIHNARDFLYELLQPHFSERDKPLLDAAGLIRTTIGRMVPAPTADKRAEDPTAILAEPYCRLPVDIKAARGTPPALKYMETFDPFDFFEEKKLYIHNMGHAICAYMGYLEGYVYVWQAVEDDEVARTAREAMFRLAAAIAVAYRADAAELRAFVGDLLRRFGNRRLGDPVSRVGQDPLRKLASGDRFMGAVRRCQSQGLPYGELLQGIAAALRFSAENDPSARRMREMIARQGVTGFLETYCGLSAEDSRIVAGTLG